MNDFPFIPAFAFALIVCLLIMRSVEAQSPVSSEVTTSEELKVKEKQLELERAKIEQQKAQANVEQQQRELEKARESLQVKESDDNLQIALSGDVLFNTNEATLKPNAKETLSNVATVLAAFPASEVMITGYTDSRGSSEMNVELSRDRAQAVKTWLIAQGIPGDRILTQGKGEQNPVASNDTEAGRQQNRRVEINVVKGNASR